MLVMTLLLGLFTPSVVVGDEVYNEPTILYDKDSGGTFTELCIFAPKGDECVKLNGFYSSKNGEGVLVILVPNIPVKEGGVDLTLGKPVSLFRM